MTPRIREPVVAGAFYPGTEDALRAQLVALFGRDHAAPGAALRGSAGIVAPHAGYLYCGKTAAAGYRWLAGHGRPDWILVLGANHTGRGAPISVGAAGGWRTPSDLPGSGGGDRKQDQLCCSPGQPWWAGWPGGKRDRSYASPCIFPLCLAGRALHYTAHGGILYYRGTPRVGSFRELS